MTEAGSHSKRVIHLWYTAIAPREIPDPLAKKLSASKYIGRESRRKGRSITGLASKRRLLSDNGRREMQCLEAKCRSQSPGIYVEIFLDNQKLEAATANHLSRSAIGEGN
jgi:hypothetical protein